MSAPPSWLAEMAEGVAATLYAVDVLAPLGCHRYHNRALDQWEVTLFAAKTETIGGRYDGRKSPSKFHVDVCALFELFTPVTAFHWQALSLGPDDDLGPHLSLEGVYQGHSVWLRILASAPSHYRIGRLADAYTLRLEDVW